MKKKNSCPFCNEPIYIKRVQYSEPLLAPLTETQALRDRLIELTGEVYIELEKRFCPVCGEELDEDGNDKSCLRQVRKR